MNLEMIKKLDKEYYMPVYGDRFDICFLEGEGVTLIDVDGKRYTDFFGGIAVNILGYSDIGFIRTIQSQAKKLLHASNYYHIESQALAAKVLCNATGYDKVFFSNSGAESNEGAIKLARKYFSMRGENRYEVITMEGSFHGRTLATLAATGQKKFHKSFEPMPEGFKMVPFKDKEALENAINHKTCAVMIEPIQGESGVNPAGESFLQYVREICTKKGVLLIADEVQTGVGRTGAFLCSKKHGVEADIVTLAKGLGSGVPVGAVLAKDEIAQAFGKGDHGSTFGGNLLATSAVYYVVLKLISTNIINNNERLGKYFLKKLDGLIMSFPNLVKETRGEGLMVALELSEDIMADEVITELLKMGFVVGKAGPNTLRFLPPYIITEEDIDSLAYAISKVLVGM